MDLVLWSIEERYGVKLRDVDVMCRYIESENSYHLDIDNKKGETRFKVMLPSNDKLIFELLTKIHSIKVDPPLVFIPLKGGLSEKSGYYAPFWRHNKGTFHI